MLEPQGAGGHDADGRQAPVGNPTVLDAAALAGQLRAGSAALVPTDTLPALAATPEHAGLLWQLKHRPAQKALILMGADLDQLLPVLGQAWQPTWLELARRHWPGALTLVLPARGAWVHGLNPGGSTLGLRIPASERARALLKLSGPLATTSANRSGAPAATTAADAHACFPSVPLLGPLPWPTPEGVASTVIAWQIDHWQTLRHGAVIPRWEP